MKDTPLYHPAQVGTRRVYARDGEERIIEVITAVEVKDGETLVTVCEEHDGKLAALDVVAVSARGLRSMASGPHPFDTPLTLLRLPAMAGDKWDLDSRTETLRVKGTATVKGEEAVEVPAGKFRAIRVDWAFKLNGRDTTLSLWYAPQIGVVKCVDEFHVQELVSVSARKD